MSVLEIGTDVLDLASGVPAPNWDVPRPPERQMEILRHMANGRSCDETAAELGICRKTVTRHVKLLCQLLGAQNRAHAVGLGFALTLLTSADVRAVKA